MAENRSNTFAAKLAEQREAAGLSQYALARKSGLTKQAVSRLELGTRSPSWETVQLLARALGVSCEEFTDPGLALPEPPPARPPGRPRKAAAAAQDGPAGGKGAAGASGKKGAARGRGRKGRS